MKLRIALFAATALAAPLVFSHAAQAQPVTGPYIAGGAGYNIEESPKAKDIYVNRVGQPDTARISLHNGWTGEASLGYGLGNGFRVEVEGDYFDNTFAKTNYGGNQAVTSGQEQKYGAFINGFYDFNLGLPVFPYLGAGVGYQFDDFDNYHTSGIFINKTKGAFAYQGIAGLAFPITAAPGLSATIEYRFTALATSRKYDGSYVGGGSAAFKVLSEYNNSIQVGLRYQLFTPQPPAPAPAPAPVAAPAPAPAKTYLVFFDWDKYNLTPRATQIISEAASDSHTNNTTTIDVSGYTDTSGTPTYNQGLSQRRAQAVAAQLVSDGVSQSEIEIHAYGETHLLVPTGPGVREPQNRRVEIVLQ